MSDLISLDNIDYRKKYNVKKTKIGNSVELFELIPKGSSEPWGTIAKVDGKSINPHNNLWVIVLKPTLKPPTDNPH